MTPPAKTEVHDIETPSLPRGRVLEESRPPGGFTEAQPTERQRRSTGRLEASVSIWSSAFAEMVEDVVCLVIGVPTKPLPWG